jgi:SAM-dependent methyltransferase
MNILQSATRSLNCIKRHFVRWLTSHAISESAISTNYALLKETEIQELDGWRVVSVAERQHQAFAPLLRAARGGKPRLDFQVAAQAVAATGLADPLVVEVGCGSGYYGEILPLLLGRSVRYVGLDYATSMTMLAHHFYPDIIFVTGDARQLPLKTACCDILFSGTSLMHIADYRQAIAEMVRVSREWCIFHTVPLVARRTTSLLRKQAYGEPVIEVIFNQSELEALFVAYGLGIQGVFESIPYDVSAILGEPTWTQTYLCRK